jgi:hypothetical protein
MSQVLDQIDRDQAIWAEWVDGRTQAEIGQRRGISQPAVSQAIARYLASIPEPERAQYRAQILARYEALVAAHWPAALQRPRVAAIVRGIIDSEARVLGLIQSQIQVGGQVTHSWEPGPTVDQVLAQMLADGRIRGELTRTDR